MAASNGSRLATGGGSSSPDPQRTEPAAAPNRGE